MDVDIGSVSLMDLLLKNQIEGPKLNGSLRVERVYGKSSTTRSYATYPLQFMIPKKVQLLLNSKSYYSSINLKFHKYAWIIIFEYSIKEFVDVFQALPSHVDAVLVYALTFGGGIVSVWSLTEPVLYNPRSKLAWRFAWN